MNCPNCKSIIKGEEKICRICGWSGDEPDSIMNWFYIKKIPSFRLKSAAEISAIIILIPLSILVIFIIYLIFRPELGGWQGFVNAWSNPFIYALEGVIAIAAIVVQHERYKERHYIYRIFKDGIKVIESKKETFYKWSKIEYFNLDTDYLSGEVKENIINLQKDKINIFFKKNNMTRKIPIFLPLSAINTEKIINILEQNAKHQAPYSDKPGLDPYFFKSLRIVLIVIAIAIIGTLIIYFTIGPIKY